MSTTTTIRRNSNQQNRSFRNFMWISMLMSLAVVFFGMQLMMVGPLKGRLDGIQTRLDLNDQNIKQLVGTQPGVTEANTLLTSLEEQSARLNDVQMTIDQIAELRTKVEAEAKSAQLAMTRLEEMANVQERVIAAEPQTRDAFAQIAQLEALRDEVIKGSKSTEVADNSLDGMLALQRRVIAASNSYEDASVSIANLTDLTQRLVDSDEQLQLAAKQFDDFMTLQNRMIASADGHEQASENLRTLVAMKDSINGNAMKLDDAAASIDRIAALHERLADQSTHIGDAVSNLELMDDFQTEISSHVRSLTSLRRSLMELAMMESTIDRVASVVGPLTEISSLRRLSDSEMREAARVILSQRNTRVSQNTPANSEKVMAPETGDDELVPLPPEARDLE